MTSPDMVTMQVDELRQLAAEMQKSDLPFDPASIRKGNVTAVSLASTPPTVTVQLSGDTTTDIPGVRVARNYTPVVGDQALLIKQGTDLLALTAVASASYGIGTTNYVRYSRSSTFTCAHNTIEKVQFNTADVTDTSTVTVTSFQDFNLVRAGIYSITGTFPWASTVAGSRWTLFGLSSSSSTRYAVTESNPANGSAVPQNLSLTRRFAANTSVSVYAYQDSGASLTLFPTASVGPLDINIAYLGP